MTPTHSLLRSLVPLVADLAEDLPERERYRRLLDAGIRALLTRGCRAAGCAAQLTFLLTAQHRPRDIARVGAALAAALPLREH